MRGMPVVVLTSVGCQERKLRKNALMRVEHDGEYAVVASLGGAPKHPVWYYNLKANPQVELQDGPDRGDYVAREVTGAEKALWWERSVAAYPDYADYQVRTERRDPGLRAHAGDRLAQVPRDAALPPTGGQLLAVPRPSPPRPRRTSTGRRRA